MVASEVPEVHEPQLTARELAQLNAYRKARAVAKRFPDHLVLGADTLVYLGHRLFGKPRDLAEARRMLEELQSQVHQVVTGVCLIHQRSHRQALLAESTDVRFKALSFQEIECYLQAIDPLDKAGGYAIQEHGATIIESITGSYSNVVGLPLERLRAVLQSWS